MSTLEQIINPVEGLLKEYYDYVKENIAIDDKSSAYMLDYIFKTKGKGIRPLIAMLSASMIGIHNDNHKQRLFLSAMIIEMVHTASLVHDDIIDEAYIRRSSPSVNALWGQKRAVLIGDYIFARSYAIGMNSGHFDLVRELSRVMSEICEGELLQESQTHSLDMTREIYNKIIYGKTASLLSSCSMLGAMSVEASAEQVSQMKKMGEDLGMAFQIKDDILDFSKAETTGKPTCNDLKERKITLPILCILEKSDKAKQKHIISKLSKVRRQEGNAEYLHNLIINEGGLTMAELVMEDYILSAKSIIALFPENTYSQSLLELCDFLSERNK